MSEQERVRLLIDYLNELKGLYNESFDVNDSVEATKKEIESILIK